MADQTRPKHFNALLILAILIALSLAGTFFIDKWSRENETTIEIINDNYNIYVTGLSALFILLFRMFFWAYRKILALLSLVGLLIWQIFPLQEEPESSATTEEEAVEATEMEASEEAPAMDSTVVEAADSVATEN